MNNEKHAWLYDLLFILVLLMAGYLRIGGYNWGEGYHQHPDELFLTGVLDNLRAHTCEDPALPVEACPQDRLRWITVGEYFDSEKSPLNPYVRGFGFFVYGNLPMTVTRILMEATANDDIGSSKFFARQMSATADLLAIFLLYLIVSRLYGRKVGLFAAAFSSLAVMQIQQSHFFTSDLFVNLFMFLTLLFAVMIVEWRDQAGGTGEVLASEDPASQPPPAFNSILLVQFLKSPLFYLSLGFGLALGMAMASKINAAAMAIVLPFAFFIRWFAHDRKKKLDNDHWLQVIGFLVIGGLATIISFRIFQPYAFNGLMLDSQWIKGIAEQRAQASGAADLPWNLQWARRSHLYSFENLTTWGLGLPLGILAWAGFLLMGWRILKGETKHLLLWGWTVFYFGWQSMQFNPTMRYQLPIYPLLCMMAAWFVFELTGSRVESRLSNLLKSAAGIVGVTVLAATAVWAFAFQSIYLRDETRMAASRWMFENVPSAINLSVQTEEGTYNQPLAFPTDMVIATAAPYRLTLFPNREGVLSEIRFAFAHDDSETPVPVNIAFYSSLQPDVPLARASTLLDSTQTTDPRGVPLTFTLDHVVPLVKDQQYILSIETMGSGLSLSGSAVVNETDYDWGLPFRVDGYDPFGGMYAGGDLVLQTYWADDATKVSRFLSILSQGDYIVIPTNHQYGQITRVPERYPFTTLYYRELIGCPESKEIIQCYREAEPGTFEGRLGFDLVAVFESYPTLGPIVINDQAAEEAFTFYDHPKVLIFKKTEDFDVNHVRAIFNTVDLTQVVQLPPRQFSGFKNLMLPESQLAAQRAGGTWSTLFDYDWLQNKKPLVGALVWYLFVFVLGLFAYPLVRLALPGLRKSAYALGRIGGLVLLAWLSWMGGSVGVPYTRVSIGVALALIVLAGIGLWWKRRQEFKEEWDANRRFLVLTEMVFLTFFLIDLLIRLGNP
ncbi:MAG TPA: glycosyltransferase family 39 protein, partial [Anaerolineales bacterium]|nr:glycosyltransferase family 39 protein [Anaerolineales bacterium]